MTLPFFFRLVEDFPEAGDNEKCSEKFFQQGHIQLCAQQGEEQGRATAPEDGWKDLTAVRQGNYTFLQKDLFHFKPNARWAEAYELLAKLLYPELKLGE